MVTNLLKEDGMKALILSDEINLFHWSVLKSVLLILSILPLSQGILHVWQSTEGSSQIMVGLRERIRKEEERRDKNCISERNN